MRLAVSSNRMTLLNLRKRLLLARRGHKMLKDKLDELMRHFLSLLDEVKESRRKVSQAMEEAQKIFLRAVSLSSKPALLEALMLPKMRVELEERLEPLMNIRIPKYTLHREGTPFCYGMVGTSSALDSALKKYDEILPQLLQLAEQEKEMALLSSEIDRTRRRVNALEYILIPNLAETIRYIVIKLEELERGNLTRLMKIKEIVRQH